MPDAYAFRPVGYSDLMLLSRWLDTPLVSRWYGEPGYIDALEHHLDDDRIRMQLVLLDDTPIAYVQDYEIHAFPNHHLAFLPQRSRGLDTFIGSDYLVGKGHGTRYLTLLAQQLFAVGIPALGIDPHPDNVLARRAYRNVGFTGDDEIESEWGRVVLMTLFAPQDCI